MTFDLSSAQPVTFDLASAKPVVAKRTAAQESAPNPTQGYKSTLQLGPFDTHIPISDNVQNFLAGAGKATYDIGRGVGQMAGLESRKDVADSRALDAPLMGTKAGKAGMFAGTVADMLPLAFIPGAGTFAGAAGIGAGTGLLQPSTSTGETLANTGLGLASGPGGLLAGRGVGALYQAGKAALEPLFRGGQERIAARTLQAFAGSPGAAQKAAQTLGNPGSVLPGVQPTTAELANNAGLAQLERAVKQNPETLTALTDRNQANRAAMTGALQDIAGTPEDMAVAQKTRQAMSSPMYQIASEERVESTPALEDLMTRPSMQNAWQRAQQLAAERGENLVSGQDIPEALAVPSLSKGPPGPTSTRDSILQYLARHKRGLNSSEAVAQGVDPSDMTLPNAQVGIKRAFRKAGMSFDQAAEMLHEAGYPVGDSYGRYDPNVLLDRISDELRGRKVYSINHPTMGAELANRASAEPQLPFYSGRAIQYLKMGLNDIADTAEQKGMGAHEKAALDQTRSSLDDFITSKVPMLKAADKAYASGSVPINQMQVGKTLSEKLIPALGDFGNNTRLTAGNYANAMRTGDQLAASVTGQPGATLAQTMGPDQMRTLTQVGEQLARRANAEELGRAAGSNTAQNLASQNVLRQFAGPLGLPQSLAERVAQSTLGQTLVRPTQWMAAVGEPRILDRLSRAALDPREAQRLLTLATRNPRVAQALWARQGLLGPLSNVVASGLMAPSLSKPVQQ